ncbi:MAG: hypothetical protein ACFFD5_10670 [Candidatus Thorarchaeota archaeon]
MNFDSNKNKIGLNKIKIISEIDQLKVIANNHYLMKRYNEAIRVAEKIIELAKSVDLKFIIKEQEEFISEISEYLEEENITTYINEDFKILKTKVNQYNLENKIYEAHEAVQKFIQKFDSLYDLNSIPEINEIIKKEQDLWKNYNNEQNNLKKKLDPLEIQLNSYLATNNIVLASETVKKAKILLKDLNDTNITKKWETLESMVSELKKQSDVVKTVEDTIEKISNLTDNYQFEDAKKLLERIINFVKEKDLTYYERNLSSKKKTVLDAEEKYNKLLNDVKSLEEEVKLNLSNYLFEKAQENCEQIIKISRFIGKNDYVKMYTELNDEIKQKLREFNLLEKLKRNVKDLNSQGLAFLSEGDLNEALTKFKKIKEHLESFLLL